MHSLLDPTILFFALGIFAGLLKSNLEIPPQIGRFLALYLLMALGLKGGFALNHTGFTPAVMASLLAAIVLALLTPMLDFAVLRRLLRPFDAAAVAATYGSVSAVTFITALQFLETRGIAFGAHMAAAMALMESPAIVLAVVMANKLRQGATPGAVAGALVIGASQGGGGQIGKVLRESLTEGAQLVLLGAMVVGILTGDAGKAAMQPFSGDLFKGMLAFFLLDMGLLAARSMVGLRTASPWLLAYAVLAPLAHAALALLLALAIGLPTGNTALLMTLAASASYIAVPAVLRHALPEANPALYVGLSLGMTFPLNILFGVPLYAAVANWAMG